MAIELHAFAVTTPAGTPASSPLLTPIPIPPRTVRRIVCRVPPGPNGQLGFMFAMAGLQVIPDNTGAWIVASDEQLSWDVSGLPDSGAWQLISYNIGRFDHTVWIRMEVDLPPGLADTPTATQAANSVLVPVVAGITAGSGVTAGTGTVAADQAAIDAALAQATP